MQKGVTDVVLLVILLSWVVGVPLGLLGVAAIVAWRHERAVVVPSIPRPAQGETLRRRLERRPIRRRHPVCDLRTLSGVRDTEQS